MTAPIAHTPPTPAASPHDLVAHLRETGCAAAQHAGKWGDAWARAAGLWHDLGKFNPAFQAYLHACIAANLAGTAPMKMRIAGGYPGHRDPEHTVRHNRTADHRFDGAWPRPNTSVTNRHLAVWACLDNVCRGRLVRFAVR